MNNCKMLDKHATWCQCTLIISFIFCGASVFSIQELTFQQDLYWFVLFGLTSVVHFIAAEHGHCYFGPDKWQVASGNARFVSTCIISSWYIGGQWYIRTHVLCIAVYIVFSYLIVRGADKKLWFLFVVVCIYSMSPLFCLLIALQSPLATIKIHNKSFAAPEMKWIAAKKSSVLFLQAILLWQQRCDSRFPMTFRWTPVFVGLFFMFMSAIYITYMIAPTKVSRNAIILAKPTNAVHNMAFSLNAAEACPECRQCITSLDMESSFGE
jgi:hypothetical protein